ncbi:hypothetical protein SEA_JSQUARED_64 [Mycobacterium phage Jsquared]|nr:hypothetical protein SEA_JSQUARED_64 [Mycobacterium phage Jsquared]
MIGTVITATLLTLVFAAWWVIKGWDDLL